MPQLPFTFRDHVRPDPPADPRPEPPAEAEAPAAPAPAADQGPTIFSVSQLQRRLRTQLERHYAEVWVAGEISNFSVNNRSGHAYFTLKDRQATLNVVMFDDHVRRLQFRPQDGLEALARGTLTVWPKGGRLQLSAVHLEPRGAGALQMAFEALVEKLRAEGLTDPATKRPHPANPRTVGVVTSRGSAAMRDVLRTLLRRDPRAHIRLAFCPVQGKSAAFHIKKAVERLDTAGCDVILLARGGGSAEDLWAFNEEVVARAVVACSVPVITGVGHETDTTIADLVADVRASTPTAAAELAVPLRSEVEAALQGQHHRLQRAMRAQLRRHDQRLSAATYRTPRPEALLASAAQTLDALEVRAERAARRAPRSAQAHLQPLERRLAAAEPRARLGASRSRLQDLGARLEQAFGRHDLERRRAALTEQERRAQVALQRRLAALDARWARAVARAEALSPLSVLARGYALVTDEAGGVVKDAAAVQPGDAVELRLARGRATAEIREVLPDEGG